MREFNISTGGTTLANGSVTLIYMRAAASPSVNLEVLRWWVGQSANATSAQQRVHITQRGTTFPTLVAATPVTLKMQDPNASVLVGSTTGSAGTSGINASAEGGSATYPFFILEDAFNVLNGWLMVPTPPETIINPAGHGTGISLRFPTAAATLQSWSFGCQFREI
jgi:hypothetical protein